MQSIEEHIQKSVADILGNLATSTKIQERLEKAIDESVNAAVNDLFSYNGPMRKAIGEKVKEACGFDPSVIDLPNYQNIMAWQTRAAYIATMEKLGVDKTKEMIEAILHANDEDYAGPLKLSTILKQMREKVLEDLDDGDEQTMTLFIERSSYGSVYIGIDKKEKGHRHSCDIDIHLTSDREVGLRILSAGIKDGWSSSRSESRDFRVGILSNLEEILTHAYVTKRPFVVDVEQGDEDHLRVYKGEED